VTPAKSRSPNDSRTPLTMRTRYLSVLSPANTRVLAGLVQDPPIVPPESDVAHLCVDEMPWEVYACVLMDIGAAYATRKGGKEAAQLFVHLVPDEHRGVLRAALRRQGHQVWTPYTSPRPVSLSLPSPSHAPPSEHVHGVMRGHPRCNEPPGSIAVIARP
jgi:hypothetical protein